MAEDRNLEIVWDECLIQNLAWGVAFYNPPFPDFLDPPPPLEKSPLVPGRLELPHCKILGDFPTLKNPPCTGWYGNKGGFFKEMS